MPKRKRRLPTLWEVPDGLWERIEPLLDQADPPKARGRHRGNRYFQHWCEIGLFEKVWTLLVEVRRTAGRSMGMASR